MKPDIERLLANANVTYVMVCACGQKNRVNLVKMVALGKQPRCGACKRMLKVRS